MSFGVAVNQAVWKDIAVEKQNTANRMIRVAVLLFVICNVLAATTYSAQSKYSSICSFVDQEHQRYVDGYSNAEITKALKSDYCS